MPQTPFLGGTLDGLWLLHSHPGSEPIGTSHTQKTLLSDQAFCRAPATARWEGDSGRVSHALKSRPRGALSVTVGFPLRGGGQGLVPAVSRSPLMDAHVVFRLSPRCSVGNCFVFRHQL